MERVLDNDSAAIEHRTLDKWIISLEGLPPFQPLDIERGPTPDQVATLQMEINKQEKARPRAEKARESDGPGFNKAPPQQDLCELLKALLDTIEVPVDAAGIRGRG